MLAGVIQYIGYFIVILPFIILVVGMLLNAISEGMDYIFSGFIGGTTFIILVISCISIGFILAAVGQIIKTKSE